MKLVSFAVTTSFGQEIRIGALIADPYDLALALRINGETISEENSGSVHRKIADMIAHASRDERLVPGEGFVRQWLRSGAWGAAAGG